MINLKKNPNPQPKCFSTIFKRLICGNNLPTHPDNDDHHDHDHQINPNYNHDSNDQLVKPGIVARLMGLDPMPDNESLFLRSKSLNSLHFFPDFKSNKASIFHRRSATASSGLSFPHLGSSSSFKIHDELCELPKLQIQSVREQGKRKEQRGSQRRKNRGNTNNKHKYEESYHSTAIGRRLKKKKVFGSQGLISSKRRDDYEVFISDSLSKSPVSVLDHHHHLMVLISPKEDGSQASSRRKASPKNKIKIQSEMQLIPKKSIKSEDQGSSRINGRKLNNNYKLKKKDEQETEMAEYFVGLLGQICTLAEEQIRDPNWVTRIKGIKGHFKEDLCLDFSGKILDLLLNDLMHELLTSTTN